MAGATYLLDTNICIYAMKGQPAVLRKFSQHGRDSLVISSLVAAELAFGAEKSTRVEENKRTLELFLQSMEVLAWSDAAIWHYARHRKALRAAGTPIGELDLLIASHALGDDLTLVTNNTREFERVQGLKLENWAQ
jgi:tRNA(fMet)-specific endonuclease VapC